jgi:hypothetical protein
MPIIAMPINPAAIESNSQRTMMTLMLHLYLPSADGNPTKVTPVMSATIIDAPAITICIFVEHKLLNRD